MENVAKAVWLGALIFLVIAVVAQVVILKCLSNIYFYI